MATSLENMAVRVTSPDNQIRAEVRYPGHLALRFRPGSYAGYDIETLERQLGHVAALAWTGYRRGYLQAAKAEHERTFFLGDEDPDPKIRRYWAARKQIEARGRSAGGWVRARSRAMLRWTFTIKPGALDRLSEEDFVTEALSAVKATFQDHDMKVILLKDEFFGFDLPPDMRAWLNKAYPNKDAS